MKGWQWLFLVAAVTVGAAFVLVPALGGDESEVVKPYSGRMIASGDWTLGFRQTGHMGGELRTARPVTGFAFGPGRAELAYCAPAERGGPSALLTAHISFPQRKSRWSGHDYLAVSPRLLATAPVGVTFRGPIWWSPEGARIALRACGEESSRLVIVDYLSGQIAAVPEGEGVVEVAWSPGGSETAFVRAEEGKRSVWVYSRETGESRRLGAGGYHLRWSLDGSALHWLRDDSEEVWTAMRWEVGSGALATGGPRPARREGALWSPDGQLCATLEPAPDDGEDRIVVYPVNSTVGETLSLPGLEPEKLLGWSPDSQFLLALAGGDVLAVVSARPPGSGVSALMDVMPEYTDMRAAVSEVPVDAEAGPPTWSSSGELLAYVVPDRALKFEHDDATAYWVVHRVQREYVGGGALPAKLEREMVTHNLKVIALGMLMYLNDYDKTFPYSDDVDYLRTAINTYIYNPSVFMRPGTENSVVVSFTIDPGTRTGEVKDPSKTPMATIDYSPEFYGIAYMDGHVEMFEKK